MGAPKWANCRVLSRSPISVGLGTRKVRSRLSGRNASIAPAAMTPKPASVRRPAARCGASAWASTRFTGGRNNDHRTTYVSAADAAKCVDPCCRRRRCRRDPRRGCPSGRARSDLCAAIDAHRKAHAAHMASLELQTRFERRYGSGQGSWISTKPCYDEDDAFEAFVAEPATTMPGLRAKMAYFEELASEFETEWMVYDRAACPALIESFAASLKNIGVLP